MSSDRIAFIAVHGVADQKPGGTARALVELLVASPPEDPAATAPNGAAPPQRVRYAAVSEERFEIPVDPLEPRGFVPAPRGDAMPRGEDRPAFKAFLQSFRSDLQRADWRAADGAGTAWNERHATRHEDAADRGLATTSYLHAGHNLSDALGLAIAWGASVLSKHPPSARYTFGLRGSSILAALFNAVFLLVAVGAIAWEAVQRISSPQPVAGSTVMIVAGVGILVNGVIAWLFASGRKGDLNIRGAFLHMAADAAVSAGVVVAGLVILYTGWTWLDPLVSLAIAAVIVASTWGLLRDSVASSLDAVPTGVEPDAVRKHLAGLPGAASVHDLHIWPMSTTEIALTCHLSMLDGHPGDAFLMTAAKDLKTRFGIGHTTLQIETGAQITCELAPDHVV